jgi:hypothetical protein
LRDEGQGSLAVDQLLNAVYLLTGPHGAAGKALKEALLRPLER